MFILCFKIFISRILDVTLSSIRTMFIVKCNKIMSSIISFFEIFIWFYTAKEALITNANSILIVISYALGYSLGTGIGTSINEYFINGIYSLKIDIKKINKKDENKLKELSLNYINIENNKRNILFLEVNKKNYKSLIDYIYSIDKFAFIIISDVKCKNHKK